LQLSANIQTEKATDPIDLSPSRTPPDLVKGSAIGAKFHAQISWKEWWENAEQGRLVAEYAACRARRVGILPCAIRRYRYFGSFIADGLSS
jgi:hypothetical protein